MRGKVLVALTALAMGCQTRAPSPPPGVVTPAPQPSPPDASPRAAHQPAAPAPEREPASAIEGDGYHADDEHIDDEPDQGSARSAEPAQQLVEHPFASWSDARIDDMVQTDPGALGSMSFGSPSGGALRGAVRMPDGEHWELVDPNHAWGTTETVEYLKTAILRVQRELPGSHKLYIGHISAKNGGHLRPHISHQSGRDVDISYYYTGKGSWYARAHAGNLDRPRTWAFVKALLAETDVEMLLIDHSIQRLLREYALAQGEDPEWLETLFVGRGAQRAVILHAPGHATHLHIRFFNPIAQETARRAYPFMVKHKLLAPPRLYVNHKVKPGETLGMLARKYHTTVRAIQRANGLKNTKIRAHRAYRIPVSGRGRLISSGRNPLLIPKRRVAPERSARAEPQALR